MSYTCPECRRTSYNPHDEAEQYCGACNSFADHARLARQLPRTGPQWAGLKELPAFGPPAHYAMYWNESAFRVELWVSGKVVAWTMCGPTRSHFAKETYQSLRRKLDRSTVERIMTDCGFERSEFDGVELSLRAIETMFRGAIL